MSYSEYVGLSTSGNTGLEVRMYTTISDDSANNRSSVTVRLQARKTNGFTSQGNRQGSINIGGDVASMSGNIAVGSDWVTLGSNQKWVSHTSDGKGVAQAITISSARVVGSSDWDTNVNGSATLEVNNFTDYTRVPGAPGANSISDLTPTGFKMSWGAASNPFGSIEYAQYLGADSGFSVYAVPTSWIGSARAYTYSGLKRGTSYWFRSRARNPDGNGSYNTATKITTPHTVPDKPPTPSVQSATQNSVTINTTDPTYVGAGVTAREIELRQGTTVVQTKTTADPVFSGLVRNGSYTARFRVQNAEGWSAWSNDAAVQLPGQPPSAPTNYIVYDIAATSATVSTGTIADNGGAAPSRVRAKISTTQSDTGLVGTVENSEWAPIRLSGLTEGTQYYVAEAAYNTALNGGWGPYGSWVPLLTKNNVPNAPILSSSAVGGTNATLQWTVPTDLNGSTIAEYHILVASNASLTLNVREFVVPDNSLAQVVGSLTNATQYWAVVWSVTDNGRGSSSAIHTFTTTGGSGSTSGVWIDINGVPKFAEVWLDVAGVPKRVEVWIDVAGVPKMARA